MTSRRAWSVRKFHSFEEAEAADVEEDAARSYEEKLAAVEELRRRVYGRDYADAARLVGAPRDANKRAAGRAKDHADAEMLEAVRALSRRR